MADVSPYAAGDEDRIDRWFNRRLAYPLAVASARLGVHPNVISMVGMLIGAASGWWFQYRDASVAWGVSLLVVATIVDNADGMVARMTNKTSEFGYVIDGLCDNVVFISVYVGGIYGIWNEATPFGGEWGPWAWLLASAAGISHSRQSSMLDFYKMEWRYWACLKDDYRFRSSEELAAHQTAPSGFGRVFTWMRRTHARQQESMAGVRLGLSNRMEALRSDAGFADRYAALNRLPMSGWFLLGPNWHVIAVCAFALAGRMDLYFWSQILLFNGVFWVTRALQASRDRQLVGS